MRELGKEEMETCPDHSIRKISCEMKQRRLVVVGSVGAGEDHLRWLMVESDRLKCMFQKAGRD